MSSIYCGDAIDILTKNIGGEVAQMIVTSPPYDNMRTYQDKSTFNWHQFHYLVPELYRVLKVGGVVIWVVADQSVGGGETGTSFKQALRFIEEGFLLYDTMIWRKSTYRPFNHKRYEQAFEYIFCFSKGRPSTFNPVMEPTKFPGSISSKSTYRKKNGSFKPRHGVGTKSKDQKLHSNIFTYSPDCSQKYKGHPARFPLQLVIDQIFTWSNPGDLVLDPFIGSGTSGEAAIKLGRKFIGIDIVPDYCLLAQERINNYIKSNLPIESCNECTVMNMPMESASNISKATI